MKKKTTRSLKARITAALRREWVKSPERNEVKRRCQHPEKRHIWRCEVCARETEKLYIDHINPVVNPAEGFEDWNAFITVLFCAATNLQGICYDCHKEKTQAENKQRRSRKKERTCLPLSSASSSASSSVSSAPSVAVSRSSRKKTTPSNA